MSPRLAVETVKMPNGEIRHRLAGPDHSAYARTEAGADGAWQKGHLHSVASELYAVEAGHMILARKLGGVVSYEILGRGATALVPCGVAHNVWLAPGTVTHTVKFDLGGRPGDWIPQPDLDREIEAGEYAAPSVRTLRTDP